MMHHGAPASSITHMMAAHGRGGDDHIGHLTTGDVVVPKNVVLKDPTILVKLKKLMEEDGQDYRGHIVGSGHERTNPVTGAPEFFGFKSIFKAALPAIGSALGFAVGGPTGAAIGGGLGSKLSGGSNTQALLSAGGSFLGSNYLGGGMTGDVAGNLTQSSIPGASTIGEMLASGGAGSLGSALGGASAAGITGALTGQSIAGLVGGAQPLTGAIQPPGPSAEATAGPKNAPIPTTAPQAAALPSTLSSFGGLDPLQQGTGIATNGLYGGGTSKPEEDYFVNLLQRQLINDKGGYQAYGDVVNPTEESYLHNNLGLQFDPNTQSLLQAIANRNASMAPA